MGDYFEMLKALSDAGLPVKTTSQSDLMRAGLVEDFKKAGLEPAKIVANNGAGMNFGGVSRHGNMTSYLVPAVHFQQAAKKIAPKLAVTVTQPGVPQRIRIGA